MRGLVAAVVLSLVVGVATTPDSGGGLVPVSVSVGELDRESLTYRTAIIGGSVAERAVVDGALARFADLPRDLPPLEIRIHPDGGCGGNRGLFRVGTRPWQVDLCAIERWVVLHELAHAWNGSHLTEAHRTAYTQRWDLESWHDPETPWRLRGSEHAADTIAWGLLDEPLGCFQPDGPIADRVEAFADLTAIDPPRLHCRGQ